MKKIDITLSEARKIALNTHGLTGKVTPPADKTNIMEIIKQSGYIQIDTLSVIQRAHHHILWTRLPDYQPQILHELHASDRRIFEYFARAASYLPMEHYRFFLPRMQQFNDPIGKWHKDRMEQYGYLMQPILERIRNEGPLSSKDFEALPMSERNGNISWKPARQALDLLALTGELMVKERRNFQKIYDLTERVLPAGMNLQSPTDAELGEFAVMTAITAMGVAREKEIYDYLQVAEKKTVADAIKTLCDTGVVAPVSIDQNEKVTYYILNKTLESLPQSSFKPGQVHILSPFDNLIIFRERTNLLFHFDYALECYLPPDKRQFGYFVHPVLWGDQIIARMDPAVDTKKQMLLIHSLHFEPGFNEYEQFMPGFSDKCYKLAKFNGCEKIKVGQVCPEIVKEKVGKCFNI